MNEEVLQPAQSDLREVVFEGGKLTYKAIGERLSDKPVTVVLPGHGGGIASHGRLAEAIQSRLGQQTIITNLVSMDEPGSLSEPVIDVEARGLLALLQQEGLANAPVNFVAHSMGALVVERAAEFAKATGYNCFKYERGSRTVFISPAGSIERDKPRKLLARLILKSYPNNKSKREELTAELPASTGQPNTSSKIKDIRLLRELGKKRLSYENLEKSGLKPAIIFYPDDQLFPWDLVAGNPKYIDRIIESADGLFSPSGMIDLPKTSAFNPSQADHYTVNFNVEPTADSIVNYFKSSMPA